MLAYPHTAPLTPAQPQSVGPLLEQFDAHSQPNHPVVASFNPLACLPIFEASQQVCLVPREADASIQAYLLQYAQQLAPGLRTVIHTKQPILKQLVEQLPLVAAKGKDTLLTDMAEIATVYADLLDCPQIGLRLEVLSHAMCPKFHIDRTGIRLLCTYLGPGTEWVDEAFCHRQAFAQPALSTEAFHQALILHPQGVRQAPPQALVLLKGSLWQGNQHAGAVHRSPQIETGTPRVVLALDALW